MLDKINLFKNERKERMNNASDIHHKAPLVVDFNVNGRCNLDCIWCWGPDHNAKEELSIEEWKVLATKLKQLGTKKITITGGEPLLKKNLSELMHFIHDELSIRTTLSTNAMLLKQKAEAILPFTDDIGIPIDGHTQELNNTMRKGISKHFDLAFEAIKFIQDFYPNIEITLRTVVSLKNFKFIHLIGKALTDRCIDLKKIRWKLYQITPLGIRKNAMSNGDWLISEDIFFDTVNKVKKTNPEFASIETLTCIQHVARYLHIYPDGKSHINILDINGNTVELPSGNVKKNFDNVINFLNNFDFYRNSLR